jgi:hypothetical protein
MREGLALAATVLCLVALVVSALDDAQEPLAFFAVAAFVTLIHRRAVREPFEGRRATFAGVIAIVWILAVAWIDALLAMYVGTGSRGGPVPPEATYLGLTASVYHLVALPGSAALVTISAWPRDDPAPAPAAVSPDPRSGE